jgi:hypothetical protein
MARISAVGTGLVVLVRLSFVHFVAAGALLSISSGGMDRCRRRTCAMPLLGRLRGWVRGAIEALVREQLDAGLQTTRYAREADGRYSSARLEILPISY